MIHFLQPEWFWLLTLLPLALLWRGRRGAVAAVQYSNVSLARQVARQTRSRAGHWVWLLPVLAGALMVVGLARPAALISCSRWMCPVPCRRWISK